MKTYYIVVGSVTDPSAYPEAVLGQPEYQFSDGPIGSVSYDFLSVEEGMEALGPANFLVVE